MGLDMEGGFRVVYIYTLIPWREASRESMAVGDAVPLRSAQPGAWASVVVPGPVGPPRGRRFVLLRRRGRTI
jgi:hypothetical protein